MDQNTIQEIARITRRRPAWEVRGPIKEKVTHVTYRFDETNRMVGKRKTTLEEVYYVHFPKGHSLRYTKEAFENTPFAGPVRFVGDESDMTSNSSRSTSIPIEEE